MGLAPDDTGIQPNLARGKAALGEGEATPKTAVDQNGAPDTKGGVGEEDFYWVE